MIFHYKTNHSFHLLKKKIKYLGFFFFLSSVTVAHLTVGAYGENNFPHLHVCCPPQSFSTSVIFQDVCVWGGLRGVHALKLVICSELSALHSMFLSHSLCFGTWYTFLHPSFCLTVLTRIWASGPLCCLIHSIPQCGLIPALQ